MGNIQLRKESGQEPKENLAVLDGCIFCEETDCTHRQIREILYHFFNNPVEVAPVETLSVTGDNIPKGVAKHEND